MQPILEYLKRRDKQNYEPVKVHYHLLKPDGIEIHSDKTSFVIGLKDIGTRPWRTAMDTAKKMNVRLATKTEWETIVEHLDEINELLESVGGNLIYHNANYWTSDNEISDAWCYDAYVDKFVLSDKGHYFSVRPVKDI